jgi:DNA-binding phage protein
MRKHTKSKLDPFADALVGMDEQGKTLPEILAWLDSQGLKCSPPMLSSFLAHQRDNRRLASVLNSIAKGAEQCREVEESFRANPAPALKTLIKLHRTLIFQLSSQAQGANEFHPEAARLADQLTRTVLVYVSLQTKSAQKQTALAQAERKLQIVEKKAAAFDQAQEVTASKLTPEEKEAEYKRIFGLQ